MSPEVESLLRLLLAAGLGAMIGFQREKAGKAAGLRTHILIGMGSALFTIVSIYGFSGAADPARIAAGVVTGIGFIGAGVIFRGMRGDKVMGITTAASIWITAAIGIAAGAGLYIIAAAAAVVTLLVLIIRAGG
jgi:putative Mg2+ transporter-C (MgtC) family protein